MGSVRFVDHVINSLAECLKKAKDIPDDRWVGFKHVNHDDNLPNSIISYGGDIIGCFVSISRSIDPSAIEYAWNKIIELENEWIKNARWPDTVVNQIREMLIHQRNAAAAASSSDQ